MSSKLKGVWIEGGVWECKALPLMEKHLIQKIKDLDNDKGCTAMNGWFAEFLGVSKSRVSQLIKSLKDKKMISIKLKFKGKEVVGRVIRILKGGVKLFKGGVKDIKDPISYIKDPSLEFSKESNIVLSNRIKEYNLREKEYQKEISLLKSLLEKAKGKTSTEDSTHDFINEVREILLHFVATTGKSLRIGKTDSLLSRSDKYKKILPRLKAGATVQECKAVISVKTKQWLGDQKMDSSLCIATLFRPSNFEKYLDEIDNSNLRPSIANYKPPYGIPVFEDSDKRNQYFFYRLTVYRSSGHLDEGLWNTEIKPRALNRKDAESQCYELEQSNPELSKIQV